MIECPECQALMMLEGSTHVCSSCGHTESLEPQFVPYYSFIATDKDYTTGRTDLMMQKVKEGWR
jgi:DNA-directed RNA polymerase subunit M/transcription elongation factor TFIIS